MISIRPNVPISISEVDQCAGIDLLMLYPDEHWVKCGAATAVELKLDILAPIERDRLSHLAITVDNMNSSRVDLIDYVLSMSADLSQLDQSQ